jgi:hypothetical protein
MILLFVIYIYAFVKGKQMLQREEWALVKQDVVSETKELTISYNFNETDYRNISIGLQFFSKKEKQTNARKQ